VQHNRDFSDPVTVGMAAGGFYVNDCVQNSVSGWLFSGSIIKSITPGADGRFRTVKIYYFPDSRAKPTRRQTALNPKQARWFYFCVFCPYLPQKAAMTKVFIFLAMLFFGQSLGVLPERDWLRRGNVQYLNGAYGDAEVSFRRALSARPDFAEASYNLAHALHKQQRYSESLAYYGRSAAGLPPAALPQLHYSRANALLQLNRLPEAANAYRQALRLQPGFKAAQKNLSYVLLKMTEKNNKKDAARNISKTQKKLKGNEKESENTDEKQSADKPDDSDAAESQSQSKSQIQSPQTQLSQPDMESLLKQLDQAEKQIRGRTTKAKAEKNMKTEEKDW